MDQPKLSGMRPFTLIWAGQIASFLGTGMNLGGALSPTFGWLVGTGDGAGVALLYVAVGAATFLTSVAGYAVGSIRDVESEIPDQDAPKV